MLKLVLRPKRNESDHDSQIETIRSFISLQQAQGKDLKELKNMLSEKGWPKSHINEAIKKHQAAIRPGKVPEPPSKVISSAVASKERDLLDNPIIRVDNISKRFGGTVVLEGISFDIEKGDLLGIIGLSGSGKSTILNTMIGFYRPDSGDVSYNHQDVMISASANSRAVRNMFGFAPQEPSFYRRLSTWENLDHFGSLYGIERKKRREFIDKVLEEMGLADAKKTLGRNLSGGMQRRLSIACSMIHQPQVLILDEPTADLDPYMRKEIWRLIRDINSKGTTIILTSHFLTEVEGLCNKIAILHDKSIRAYGRPDDLKKHYSRNQEIAIELISNDYTKIVKALQKEKLNISDIAHKGNRLVVYSPDAEKVLHHMIHLIEKQKEKIVDIELNKPSLNEIFESYIKKP